MVDTIGYLYPALVQSIRARTPYFNNVANIQNNPAGSAAEGNPYTTLPYAWISLPAGAQSDTLSASNFNANVPLNAKVNGIAVEIIRSGDNIKDTWVALRIAGNYLANKAKQRVRTDENLMLDWYGDYNSDLWGASKILPADINVNNGYNGFSVSEVITNALSVSNLARIHSIGVKIGFTKPTYSLISNLPSVALLGNQINYQIILTNTNNTDNQVPIPVSVPIPAGFTLVSATSSEGIYNESTGVWSPVLNFSTSKATLNLVLKATTVGTWTQTVRETEFNTTLTKTCNIVGSDQGPINYTDAVILDSKTLSNMNDGEIYTIGAYNKVVDAGVSGIFAGVKNNYISVLALENNLASANIATGGNITGTTSGVVAQGGLNQANISISTSQHWIGTKSIGVYNATQDQGAGYEQVTEIGKTYTTRIYFYTSAGLAWKGVAGPTTVNLTSVAGWQYVDITYTATATSHVPRLLRNGSASAGFYWGGCITVEGIEIPTGDMQVSTGDIITDEVFGTRVTAQSVYQRVGVTFRYDASKILAIRMYGQYQSVSTSGTDEWAGFTLKEGYDISYDGGQNLLEDPNALLENAEYSLLNIPASGKSAVYSFNTDIIPEQIGQSPFIKGIQLVIDAENRVNSGIQVQIKSSSGAESEIKTRNFTDENSQIILGDDSDMWDLVSEDIFLEDLTIEVIFSNISQSAITPGYKNLQLILYWMDDETRGNLGFTLIKPGMKGEHSRVYGIFLKPGGIPDGLNPVYSSLRLNKTDGALPIGLDADESELPLEFVVWGSTLQEAYEKLQKISDWLSNDRKGNIPLTNGFIYDAKPSVRYDAILSDVIDVNENVTSLECKTKLTVPKGVAIDVNATHTGAIGANTGKITVYPTIEFLTNGSSSIVVTDNESGDVITINHTITSGTTIYIDCENRTVKDASGNDLTQYVAMTTIWFAINPGQSYNITITGGTLQDVYYYLGH